MIMTYLIIISIAIIYALIRAGHDASINEGVWKKWATAELIFWTGIVVWKFGSNLADYCLLPFIFILWWSIFFDSICGLWRAGKLFYYGSGEWDSMMKRITEKPVYLFIWKVIWLIIASGAWLSWTNEYF